MDVIGIKAMSGSSGSLLGGILLGVVCGAVVGAGATYALFGGGTQPGAGPVTAGTGEVAQAEDRSGRDAGPALPEMAVARTEGGEAVEGAPRELLASVEDMLAAAPRPRAAVGAGRIIGTVKDPAGQPVPGVTIRARRNATSGSGGADRRGQGPPAPESLQDRVQRSVQAWYREQSERREAMSGADGTFELTGLLPGTYRLEGWREGATVTSEDRWWEVAPGGAIHFTARILLDVPVVVRLPDGSLAESATLEVNEFVGEGGSSRSDAWSADQPNLQLAAGRYEVKATRKEGGGRTAQELASGTETFTLVEGEPAPSLDLTLQGRRGIRGLVLAPEGEPFDSAVVSLMPLPAGQEPNLSLLAQNGTNEWVHNRDREFGFLDLAPGRYVVGVARDFRQPIVAHAVHEVQDRMVFQDLEIPPLDASECVVVRAQGPDGAPVLDLDFRVRWERRNSSTSTGTRGIRKPNDTWWVTLPEEAREVLQGRWDSSTSMTLEVESARYGSKSVPLTQGQRAVLVRFVDPASLTVRVPGYFGSGLEGLLSVHVQRDEGDRRSTQAQTSQWSEEGTVEASPLEPGDYLVLLQASTSGRFRDTQEILRQPVTVRPGPNEVTLAIPALYTLQVRVPDAEPGSRMNLQGTAGSSSRSVELDDEGIANFEYLTAGTWRLEYYGGGMPGFMSVQVPHSGVVVFEAQPINALECRILDPNGALAKAGLQDGDLVIAVEGKEFQNLMELQAVFLSVASKGDVEFTIDRNGRTFPVTVNGLKVMNSPQEMGGTFEPTSR